MAAQLWLNIGSGNGLLPDGTKPLPEPMLSCHQRCSVAFTLEQFHKKCSWTQSTSYNFTRNAEDLTHIMAWCERDVTPLLMHLGHISFALTLNVRGPSYLGLTRSISWLMMPWFVTSPGHQQPWYWLCRLGRSWSYLRKDFKYLCHVNVLNHVLDLTWPK